MALGCSEGLHCCVCDYTRPRQHDLLLLAFTQSFKVMSIYLLNSFRRKSEEPFAEPEEALVQVEELARTSRPAGVVS